VPTQIPFDLTQKGALDLDWRNDYRWPLPASALYGLHARLTEKYVTFVTSLEPDARDVALLGKLPSLGALVEAAYTVQAEGTEPYLTGPPELSILRGKNVIDTIYQPSAGHHGKVGNLRHRTLRQIARTASWSRAGTLLPNLLSPQAIALSHNRLMRDYISIQGASVGFRHGAAYLEDITAQSPTQRSLPDTVDIDTLTDAFLDRVVTFNDLDPNISERLHQLIRPTLKATLQNAASTLSALRSCTNLPKSIWSGTGAAYPARAVGLEVLRRGGEAWRFDHGGTAALSSAHAAFAASETSVSSHVVMPTTQIAENHMLKTAQRMVSAFRPCQTLGHTGDPSLDVGNLAFQRATQTGRRRRVLYVSTAFYGFYQTSTPVLPGVAYMEWQMRLVEALQRLPIELACKPHPEGLLRGKNLPTEKIARTLQVPFEEALNESDVLVMDIPASTTFSIALTTDRPIVFFDFGLLPFNDSVRDEIGKRCRILTPTYNAANQPQIDPETLAEYVCGGDDTADPTFFRNLFLNDAT